MSNAAPPDAETLRKFALGDLTQGEWDRVARHLEARPQLRPDGPETLAELGTDDTFVSALRAASAELPVDPPELRSIIASAAKLVGNAETADLAANSGTHSLAFSPDTDAEISLPDGRLGRFRIVRELGRGGMGVVFAAHDERLDRAVALKVMAPKLAKNPVAKERFLREARNVAQIDHDNVVPILEVGENGGMPYFAMPLLRGQSLDDRLKAGPMPVAEVLAVARGTAEGLAAAHAGGLIHRDIKPSNVWLEANDVGSFRRARLLDFGLARQEGDADRVTASGTILGTPAFMAPEQARADDVDARADLFSLGCVLYRTTTGRNPFLGTDTYSILSALAVDTPPSPRGLNPSVPRGLNDLIVQLLAKDPKDRPQTAREVLRRLEAIPTAESAPIRKRSRLLPVAAIALSLIGLAGVLFGGTIVRIATNKGELVVEVNDANVEIVVKQNGAVVVDKTKDRRFVLTAMDGEIEFLDPETGVTAQTKAFRLTRGGADRVVAKMGEGKAKVESAKPNPTADIERAASLYAISIGGTISIDGGAERIADAAALPKSKFQLTAVYLANNKKVDDRAVAIFAGCPKLEVLDFALTGITDAGLIHLRSVKTLKAVLLYSTRITDAGMEHLAGNLGLETLDVHETQVTDAGLARFKDCKSLHSVDLRSLRITNDGLRPFAGCKLGDLKLANSPITDDGLAHLNDTDNIRNLDLTYTKITDRGLKHLVKNKRLAAFWIGNIPITDDGLAQLDLAELVDFTAQGTALTDRALTALAKLPILRYIDVRQTKVTGAGILAFRAAKLNCTIVWDGGTIEPAVDTDRRAAEWVLAKGGKVRVNGEPLDIANKNDLPAKPFQLTRIDLSYLANLAETDLAVFDGCRHLRELDLRATKPTAAWFAHFRNCPDLEVLLLDYTGIGDGGLQTFKDCHKLKALGLAETKVTAAGLAHFAGCAELTDLRLEGDTIDDAAAAHFKDCKKLRKLMLRYAAITDAGMAHFAGCRDLAWLDLADAHISDIGFRQLKDSKLTEAHLNNTRISDAGLEAFAGNREIYSLHLSGTKVTDAGLAKLKNCESLSTLNLVNLPITDDGLAHLAGLKFAALQLSSTKVTDAGLVHLKASTRLSLIELDGTAVTDKGLIHLRHCKELKSLTLSGLPTITGAALKELELGQLESLSVPRTAFSDDGLALLAKCTNLRMVHCEESKVTRAGVEKLHDARPKCTIVWNGGTVAPK